MESLKVLVGAKIATATLLAATAGLVAATMFAPQRAAATPAYAAQTKLPCGQCHVSPAGGGALKPFGQKFQDKGHKLK